MINWRDVLIFNCEEHVKGVQRAVNFQLFLEI